jgi:hypothetical protein
MAAVSVGHRWPNMPNDPANKLADVADIHVVHPQIWERKNRLLGTPNARVRHWTFDPVYIGGAVVDQDYVDDSTHFDTEVVSELIFRSCISATHAPGPQSRQRGGDAGPISN